MATSWDSSYPPRAQKNSRWPGAPGVYVNVELRVSRSEHDKIHGGALTYASKNMKGRIDTVENDPSIPSILTPGRHQPNQPRYQQRHQERTRGLAIRTSETPERGRSAPPTMSDRSCPISPLTPDSPVGYRDSLTQPTIMERPLPPTPGRFRLGDDDLPWSTPPSYWNAQPTEPANVRPSHRSLEPPPRRLEDPQRVRDLSELQQAMMTVDSLSHDVWDPWMWDSVGDLPRGPRSIGWAVSSNDAPNSPNLSFSSPVSPVSPPPPPPPYVVSQFEHACGRRAAAQRPKSTG
jgi:hypothetical protein